MHLDLTLGLGLLSVLGASQAQFCSLINGGHLPKIDFSILGTRSIFEIY